ASFSSLLGMLTSAILRQMAALPIFEAQSESKTILYCGRSAWILWIVALMLLVGRFGAQRQSLISFGAES
ncbi:hypothetical protein AVDCRST_MAG94-590, partial [uncultured Leptolyngbya sp.]